MGVGAPGGGGRRGRGGGRVYSGPYKKVNKNSAVVVFAVVICVGEWGWGVEGKQDGSMDEEPHCYTLHVIYNMNGTQVISAILNHDFNTKPYVKDPRYDKTFR